MNTFSRHRIRPAATSVSVWTLAVLVACLGLHQLWVYFDANAPHVAVSYTHLTLSTICSV